MGYNTSPFLSQGCLTQVKVKLATQGALTDKHGPEHLRTGETLAGPREELIGTLERDRWTFHFLGERTESAVSWGPAAGWCWQLLVGRTAVISA